MKAAHISDTHILTLKRHDEFRQVFEQIYKKCISEKVDYIVHTGDLFHSKLQLTPECVSLAVEFLKKLSDIAPLYMIPGNHDCVSSDTSILTKNRGWINIAEYVNSKCEDDVATFSSDKEKIEWQKPYGLIKKAFSGKLFNLKSSKIDQLVTPTHQVLSKKYAAAPLHKHDAKDVTVGDLIPICGNQEEMTDEHYYQLLGFSFADATFVLRTHQNENTDIYQGSRVQFHFKKERKIKFLESLLNKLSYSYNNCLQKDGSTYIRIYSELGSAVCKFFAGKKEVPVSLLSLTDNQIKNFIFGYLSGDGSKISKNTYSATTISKISAELLCSAARIVGYSSHISESTIFGKYENSKQQYCFYITTDESNKNSAITCIEEVEYNDYVYCIGVPNQNFLIQRNDKISITGNCNLRNGKRLNSISPIIEAIGSDRIHFLKDSGVYETEHCVFNAMSMLDADNWQAAPVSNKPVIALYHGSIKGVVTDTGYVIEHGENDLDIFEGHDYAMLGDIHLANQKVDDEGRCVYAGSTVQNNFGEADDKGFLIWDIKDKNNFRVEHIRVPCPKPFATIRIWLDGSLIEEPILPKGSRIRLISDVNIPIDRVKTAIDTVKAKYKPESVTYTNKAGVNKDNLEEVSNLSKTLNLRDLQVQEELIKEFIKDHNPDGETLEKIYELNRKYAATAEQNEDVARNIKWKIKVLEWDNLFNYGEGNRIDFTKLNGIVGVLGKNASGKSSIWGSLLYTIFNNTDKNSRKNLNIINQTRDIGKGRAVLDIDGVEYVIDRKSEKYTKKSKGVESVEAKTDVEFTAEAEGLLTGLDRSDTDKVIRKHVGTIDDFLLTSMASQFNALSFIDEGSTNRKTILAKFLDLDIFESKFKLAKSDASEVKAVLKKLDATDFDSEILSTKNAIETVDSSISNTKEESTTTERELKERRESLLDCQSSIKSIKSSIPDTSAMLLEGLKLRNQRLSLENWIDDGKSKLKSYKEKKEAILSLPSIKLDEFMTKKAKLEALTTSLASLESKHQLVQQQEGSISKKVSLLSEVPCGDEYRSCKFIKDAHAAKTQQNAVTKEVVQLGVKVEELQSEIAPLKSLNIEEQINKWNASQSLLQKILLEEKTTQLTVEKHKVKLTEVKQSEKEIEDKLEEAKKDQVALDSLDKLISTEVTLRHKVNELEMQASSLSQKITTLYRDSGYHISKLETLEEQKIEQADCRRQFAAYDLYLKAMHTSGISYQVIKNKLPVLNSEINKVLTNIVDFQVFLVNEGDKLEIMIKHPKYDPRPLEMGSGAEKSLASIAIRLALLTVSSLPVSEMLILDEPGTSLDGENLAGFIRVLELLKGYFKVIFLVSHLDTLKDVVDMQINIEKNDNYAYVNI